MEQYVESMLIAYAPLLTKILMVKQFFTISATTFFEKELKEGEV
jgi:hypothetical protein